MNVPLVQSIHHHPRPSDKMEKRTSLHRPSEGWETIKKTVVPGRKSDYFLQKGMKGKTESMYRFSEHADRIRSTDPSLNTSHEGSSLITQPHSPPLTFGIVRESVSNILSPMLKDKKHILEHKKSASLLPKLSHQSTCFNHPAQQVSFFLCRQNITCSWPNQSTQLPPPTSTYSTVRSAGWTSSNKGLLSITC